MELDIEIINKLGLHARAAAKMAALSSRYASTIQVGIGTRRVDAKSVMSLMLLAAAKGTILTIASNGEDEQEAMSALTNLIEDRFGEGE